MGLARHNVLSFGYNAALLKKREAELRGAGFEVDTTSSLQQALAFVRRNRYHLAIVGHVVGERERNRLASALKSAASKVPVIFLCDDSIRNADLADAILRVSSEPEALIAAANTLIAGARSANCGA